MKKFTVPAKAAARMIVAMSPATTASAASSPLRVEEAGHDRARHEPREREEVAVGEVDELEDAVDERVAERDDRVDGTPSSRR